MRKYLVILICVFLFVGGCSSASKEDQLKDGMKLIEEGNRQGAIVYFRNSLEQDPNFFEARYELGKAYYELGRLDPAEKEFLKVVTQSPDFGRTDAWLCRVYLASKQYDKAIERGNAFLQRKGPDAEILDILGSAYYSGKGMVDTAEDHFEKALATDPDYAPAIVSMARIALASNKQGLAKDRLLKALDKDPDNIPAMFLLAKIHEREGNDDGALGLYEKIHELKPEYDHRTIFLAGLRHAASRKKQQLLERAKLLLEKYPDQYQGHTLMGMKHFLDGAYEDAITSLQRANSFHANSLTHYYLGLASFRVGRLEQSINHMQKVLDAKPELAEARIMLAMVLLKQRRFDDAIQQVELILHRRPDHALSYNVLGSAYLAKGEWDKGMEAFETATRLNPGLADAHYKKGIALLSVGDTVEGEKALLQTVALAPEVMNSRLVLATHYLQLQNYSEAIRLLQEGLTGGSMDAVLHNNIANAFFRQGKDEKAKGHLEKAKKSDPKYFTPYLNLAAYYTTKGEYEQALKEYEAILALDSENLKAMVGAGILADLLGDQNKAIALFVKAKNTGMPNAYNPLLRHYLKNKNHVEAINLLSAQLKSKPSDQKLLEQIGRTLRAKGEPEEALEFFRRLEKLAPSRGITNQVSTLVAVGRADDAIAIAMSAIRRFPDEHFGYASLASIHNKIGNLAQALEVIDGSPEAVRGHMGLRRLKVDFLLRAGKAKEAIEQLERLRSEYPNVVGIVVRIAAAYDEMGDKRKAMEAYERALEINPRLTVALNNLSYLYADNYGKHEEALMLAMRAVQQEPDNPMVLETLGYAMHKNGQNEEAKTLLLKVAETLSGNPMVKYHLALVYAELGDRAAAKKMLTEALEMDAFPERQKAERMIQDLR